MIKCFSFRGQIGLIGLWERARRIPLLFHMILLFTMFFPKTSPQYVAKYQDMCHTKQTYRRSSIPSNMPPGAPQLSLNSVCTEIVGLIYATDENLRFSNPNMRSPLSTQIYRRNGWAHHYNSMWNLRIVMKHARSLNIMISSKYNMKLSCMHAR